MKPLPPLVILLLTSLAASGFAAGTKTFTLKPVALGSPSMAYVRWAWSAQKPKDARAMPDFGGKTVRYVNAPLGDGKATLMAVTYQGQDIEVYVDHKGRGSLAGEKPIAATRQQIPGWGGPPMPATPVITVPVKYWLGKDNVVTHDYSFGLVFMGGPGGPPGMSDGGPGSMPPTYLAIPNGWRGEVELGGKKLLLTVIDGDGDGKIKGSVAQGRGRDWMTLTPATGETKEEPARRQPICTYLESGGSYSTLTVRPDGAQVTLTPYTGPLSKLIFWAKDGDGKPLSVSGVQLYSRDLQVSRHEKVDYLHVPPGQYSLSYTLAKGTGAEAQSYTFSLPRPVKVEAGKAIGVRCGGKLDLSFNITEGSGEAPGTLSVEVSATVPATGHSFRATPQNGAAGVVEVLNSAGRVVGSANATYG